MLQVSNLTLRIVVRVRAGVRVRVIEYGPVNYTCPKKSSS